MRVFVLLCALPLAGGIAVADDNAAADYRSFTADRQAFHRGDILTVIITETAAATSTARTRADKQDKIGASVQRVGAPDHAFAVGANNQFDGGGQIQRTGQLVGKLTVVIDSVDSNGNLWVSGEQNILINNEQQRITVRGAIRRDDIAPDNTIPSWRISQAQIEFKGKGILARKQSPGLLAKLFDLFGLN